MLAFYFLLACSVFAKQIGVVADPNMTSLTTWTAEPSSILCKQCSSIQTVRPIVPNGYYLFTVASDYSYMATLQTPIVIPAKADFLLLGLNIQVGNGSQFSLSIDVSATALSWSGIPLNYYSGAYGFLQASMPILPSNVDRDSTLLLTINAIPGAGDYLSINQVELYANAQIALSPWIYVAVGFSVLIAILVICLIVGEFRRRRFRDRQVRLLAQEDSW